MSKFKVGDIVVLKKGLEANEKYGLSYFRKDMEDCLFPQEITHVFGDGVSYLLGKGAGTYCYTDDMLEPYKPKPDIIITVKGNTTTATMQRGGKVLREAKAMCSPEDKFSLEIGAKLALERLFEKEGSFDWEGFCLGKFAVYCRNREVSQKFLKGVEKKYPIMRWNLGETASEWSPPTPDPAYYSSGGRISHGSQKHFENIGCKIVEYKG